jgi:hypothetical protein
VRKESPLHLDADLFETSRDACSRTHGSTKPANIE